MRSENFAQTLAKIRDKRLSKPLIIVPENRGTIQAKKAREASHTTALHKKIIKIILFFARLAVTLRLIVKIKKRRYIQLALALVTLLIIAGSLLVNSPRVQQRVSVLLATELENRIGTRVNLGGVHWLFPNDIVIDSLAIDDQEGEQLLSISRLAAKVEWMPLIHHRQLSIRNVRLFHPDIHLYQTNSEGDYNCQFLIDAFASKQEKKKSPSRLSLRINTLLIRHAHVCHRAEGEKVKEEDEASLQLSNLAIDDLSAQLSLKALSADSLSFIVRHLSLKEQSGLHVKDLYFRLVGNRHGATLANFRLDLPHSSLQLDTVWAAYEFEQSKIKLDKSVFKGAILPSSHITPADLAPLQPQLAGITEEVYFDADFIGSPSRINLKALNIHTAKSDLVLRAQGKMENKVSKSPRPLTVNLQLDEATLTPRIWTLLAEQAPSIYGAIPQELVRIGGISATGELHHDRHATTVALQALTDAGDLKAQMKLDSQGGYTATLDGEAINVGKIIPESPLAQTDLALQAQGQVDNSRFSLAALQNSLAGTLTATATHTHILGYEYGRIGLNGSYAPNHYAAKLVLDDPHGAFALDATYRAEGKTPRYTVVLRADSLDLHTMQLIGLHENATFSTRLKADFQGADLDHIVGKVIVDSLTMHRPTGDYLIKEMALYASDPEDKMLSLKSDFMDATVRGMFTYRSLMSSLLGHLHHSLPSLCYGQSHIHAETDNLCLINIGVYNTEPLRELFLIPVSIGSKAQCDILINDAASEFKATASVPHLEYDNNTLQGISLDCHSQKQGVDLYAGATLNNEGTPAVTASLVTQATDDQINLGALWNSNPAGMFEGTFHTRAAFALDKNGKLTAAIATDSTQATLSHSVWHLAPFNMDISPERILIDGLHFANSATQHLSANGVIDKQGSDTLQVEFTGLDLGYLLSFVKLGGISFDGKVSGHADMAGLYTDLPYIEANIEAQDFTFCDGPLGDLDGHIHWNQNDAQLQFNADIRETPRHTTAVDGIVDLKRDELWIDIAADSTNVSFLNELLKSFMREVKGNATGHLTVGGSLKAIDLDGALMTDVSFNLTPTAVNYHFKDSLRFTPGVIRFDGIEAFDQREQKAIVAGAVTHDNLKDFSYDLYIDAQNVLGIDLPDTGHDNFYTTIYGTGEVHVKGSPTMPLTIGIQASPEKGSLFALNLASQNVSSSDAFITFTDRSAKRNVPTIATRTQGRRRRTRPQTEQSTSLDLDITAHITPDATLKLVMDQAVDDHISVSGSGDLQVDIFDDDISLFGTYTVSRGSYRLSLQDVINKNFDVLPGSTVAFEGDPMAARLNITARHTINYVPLKDLSPDMKGNVRVNCLLRIGGTLDAPTVAFDLELPQGTEEERALLRSLTTTEEQMSLQFIYLLGLRKFYTPDMAQSSQGATGNVESFISSTISGQINNLLSSIISNENWNFASNLRADNMMTGESDLGGDNWDNMEIEGILEGRLLDNRLLINGSFGYRDNPMYATNFIGDFDIRYLLTGGFSLKGYNKTNDRYFSRTSLTTQGLGLVFQRDFDGLLPNPKREQTTVAESNDSTMVTTKKKRKRK